MKWKIITKVYLFFGLLFCSLISFGLDCSTLTGCCTKSCDHGIIFIFSFDNDIKYHCMLMQNPDRLVMDLDGVNLKTILRTQENDYVKNIRSNDHNHQYLRLVLDLQKKLNYSVSMNQNTHELSICLKDCCRFSQKTPPKLEPTKLSCLEKNEELSEPVATLMENTQDEISPTKIVKTFPKCTTTLRVEDVPKAQQMVIVIDPGHGGKDPGAAGPHGAKEKDVVLRISKELQCLLNQEPGFTAVLTRSTDIYIPLRKRLAIARKNHADMFVAIHADAYNHSLAAGASVYALSQRGATSEAAKWLAEKENESELGGLSSELADKDAILRSVLIDLSQTHTIESSLEIGHTVLQQLGQMARLHHPRVEQAAFVVLKSPDIPSILVETGFLSNPNEEIKLTNREYQRHTAFAIKEGIKNYFIVNSPYGRWFCENRRKVKKIVTND